MPFVIETLDSLKNQTVLPDEIILSDNFSTDGTAGIFKQFAEINKNSKYVRSQKYLEFGPSFNFAISHSKSDWVFFLHSDDLLSRYAVKNIRQAITKVDDLTGVISFKAEIICEHSSLKRASFSIGRTRYEHGTNFILKNLSVSTINFGAVAINRKIFNELGKFDEQYSYWLDLKYFHKLAMKYKILRVPVSVLRYRKYSYERTADNRREIDLINEIYWNQKYLPTLFKKISNSSESVFENYTMKKELGAFNKFLIVIMETILTQKFLILLLVKLRILLDKLGLGNFGY
jgi:glycosyltransferase involved in cell wall biosynthesis